MTDEPLIIDTKFHVVVNGVMMYCLGVALTLSILGYIGESYVWLGFAWLLIAGNALDTEVNGFPIPGDISGSITRVTK